MHLSAQRQLIPPEHETSKLPEDAYQVDSAVYNEAEHCEDVERRYSETQQEHDRVRHSLAERADQTYDSQIVPEAQQEKTVGENW